VASSVSWKSGPGLFYHIYCMITSSKMETTEVWTKGEDDDVRGSWETGWT
jgi:hypothetical protein